MTPPEAVLVAMVTLLQQTFELVKAAVNSDIHNSVIKHDILLS